MLVTILKNISAAAFSLWIISIMIFLLSKSIPGDPVDARLGFGTDSSFELNYEVEYQRIKKDLKLNLPPFYFSILPANFPGPLNVSNLTQDEVQKKRSELLNQSKLYLPKFHWHGLNNQYHYWIFSPGNSIVDGKPVGDKISRSLVWTMFLVLVSVLLSYASGILIGLGLALVKSKRLKYLIETVLFGIYALPIFWLATLLLVFFTTKEYGAWTNIFPSVGLAPIDLGEAWYARVYQYGGQLILPGFVLLMHNLAFLATLTKRNIDKSKKMGFVQTSRAYGFSEKEILFKEVFPISLIPLITSLSSAIPSAIGGSLVIEIIFNIPGIGRLLYNAILNYDWPVVFPVVMMIAVFTFISFLLADVFYRVVDPRIQ